jgi:hypothetical protein
MVAIDLLDMAVLRLTLAPSQHDPPVGQEHGRTIPLAILLTAAVGSGRGQRDYPTIPGSANGIGKGTETWESLHFRTTRKPDKSLVRGGDGQRGG